MTMQLSPVTRFGAQLAQGQKTIQEHVLEIDLTPAERSQFSDLFDTSLSGGTADWSHVQLRAVATPDRKRDALVVWDQSGVYGVRANTAPKQAFLKDLVKALPLGPWAQKEVLQAIDYQA